MSSRFEPAASLRPVDGLRRHGRNGHAAAAPLGAGAYEFLLRFPDGREELLLGEGPLAGDDELELRGHRWRIAATEPASHDHFTARLICEIVR